MGNIFCYYTARADWHSAEQVGRLEKQWLVDQSMIDEAHAVMNSCLEDAEDIRLVTEKGIRTLVATLQRGWRGPCQEGLES